MYDPQFFSVPRPEGFLLLVEKNFQLRGDPGLVVGIAACSLGRQGGLFTEFNVFCDAVRHAVDVLPMWLTKHIPASGLEAVM